MFCSNCGEAIDENASFCEHCGSPASSDAARRTTRTSGTSEAMADPLLGRKLDGIYELHGVLGHGGMGTVYRSVNIRLDQPVAVKVLAPNLAANEQLMSRFEAEGRIQARLRHPNIVAVQDFVEEGGVFAIVMELVAGQPLDELILEAEGPLPVGRIVGIMGQVLRAIGYAHEHKVIHRDIKPANIIISSLQGEEVAKVMDFGIAKAMADGGALTGTSAQMGTVWYMSPEQCKSSKYVDERSDIYSLGVVLYEMATGQLPFDSDSELELMMSHLERPVPLPSSIHAGVSPALSAVIVKALAKDPEARYQNAEEMAAALASLDEVAPVPPAVEAPAADVDARAAVAPTAVVVHADPARARPGRPAALPWVIAGLALLVVAGLTAALYLRSPSPGATEDQKPSRSALPAPEEREDEETSAWLKLQTNVTGATVLVDGQPRGSTPLKKPLRLGADKDHTIEVTAPSRVAWKRSLKLRQGQTRKLKVTLPFRGGYARYRAKSAADRLFAKLKSAGAAFTKEACGKEQEDTTIEVVATVQGGSGTVAKVQVNRLDRNGRLACAEGYIKTLKIAPPDDGEDVQVRLKIEIDWFALKPLKRIRAVTR